MQDLKGKLEDIKLHNSDYNLGEKLRHFLYDSLTDKGLYIVRSMYVKTGEDAVSIHFNLVDFDDAGEDEYAFYIYDDKQVVVNKYDALYIVIDIEYLEETLRKDIHDMYQYFQNMHSMYSEQEVLS